MKSIFSALFLLVMAGLLLPVQGLAKAASTADASQAFIDQIASDVLSIVKNDALEDDCKTLKLQELFAHAVDIKWVGKFVLGRHYRAANDEQKIAYLDAYEPFIIHNYVGRLTKYTGQTYEITSTRKDASGDHLVSMKLLDPNGPPILLDYRVRGEKKADFKVVDIIVENVSLITTQRSEFNAVVNNKGLDFLIKALVRKAEAAKK